jgi:hypothetical protein
MLDPSDEFHDPDFATSTISLDGKFRSSVEPRKPFAVDLPLSFKGSFVSPFKLNLLNVSAANITRPDVKLEINIPNFGDMKHLSFGSKFI